MRRKSDCEKRQTHIFITFNVGENNIGSNTVIFARAFSVVFNIRLCVRMRSKKFEKEKMTSQQLEVIYVRIIRLQKYLKFSLAPRVSCNI